MQKSSLKWFYSKVDRKPDQYAERALLVWSPTNEIMDAKCKFSFIYTNFHFT